MAEFCLDCFNEYCRPKGRREYGRQDVTLSWGLDLCEGCGEYKQVVVDLRPEPLWRRILRRIFLKK